ncbi:MAG TPA: hypothetical protein VFX60_09960 [Micromonospora sp.]|nr:hypothetical protein [Micromonospora sp.]
MTGVNRKFLDSLGNPNTARSYGIGVGPGRTCRRARRAPVRGPAERIALARTFYRNPPILVLVEAASALDFEAEAVIHDGLGEVMTGRTVIAIAHRLSTIARMDRIVVLDVGRIAEQGTHADSSQQPQLQQ